MKAAGLNGADMLQLAGRYPAPPGSPPDIPGLELAGEVVGAGPGAARFEDGDRVMAVAGGGGQAELAVVHERPAMPVPGGARLDRGRRDPGGLHHGPRRALHPGGLIAGERLLVHGGAGGVGIAAVQLGTMAGARVTATVRDADAPRAVAALGVHAIEPDEFEARAPTT